jgi:hypothetical protein
MRWIPTLLHGLGAAGAAANARAELEDTYVRTLQADLAIGRVNRSRPGGASPAPAAGARAA